MAICFLPNFCYLRRTFHCQIIKQGSSISCRFHASCSSSCRHRGSLNESPPLLNKTADEENKRLAELFQDPFWRDQVDDHHTTISVIQRERKLVDFFQDNYWSEQVFPIHTKPSISSKAHGELECNLDVLHVSHMDTTSSNVVRENSMSSDRMRGTSMAIHCCFPSLSPRHGSRRRKRETPANNYRKA